MPEDIPAAAFTLARARALLDEVRNPGAWCPIIRRCAESLREVTLAAAENRIADLWPLPGLGRLHRLDLAGNAVADVSALGDVSGLVWLRLLGNPDSHALPLGGVVARFEN